MPSFAADASRDGEADMADGAVSADHRRKLWQDWPPRIRRPPVRRNCASPGSKEALDGLVNAIAVLKDEALASAAA